VDEYAEGGGRQSLLAPRLWSRESIHFLTILGKRASEKKFPFKSGGQTDRHLNKGEIARNDRPIYRGGKAAAGSSEQIYGEMRGPEKESAVIREATMRLRGESTACERAARVG